MPLQSPEDPRFRCNICKEYYSAEEYPKFYKCPIHGYICDKHVINFKPGAKLFSHTPVYNDNIQNPSQTCTKALTKYVWSKNEKKWIEEGKKISQSSITPENKAAELSSFKKGLSALLTKFEKGILTKEAFITELKKIIPV